MKRMRKATAMAVSAFMIGAGVFTGCSSQAEEPQQQEQQTEAKTVVPLPAAIDVKAGVQDATFPVSFCADDFEVDGDTAVLSVVAYAEDIYDAVDITTLAPGDKLLVDGKEIEVTKVEESQEGILVNGGLGESETGTTFVSNGGGTFRVLLFDDHTTYTELGSLTLPVSKDCCMTYEVLEDGADGGELQTITVSADELEAYLQELKENGTDDFNKYNTTVEVADGKLVSICRRWIP